MSEYLIQALDNNGHWGHADWRETLTEAKACADERASKSLHGKARVVHWAAKGKYFPYRVTKTS